MGENGKSVDVFCGFQLRFAKLKPAKHQAPVFAWFYKRLFPKINAVVHRNGGDAQDAEDVYHDALMVLFRQVRLQRYDEQYEVAGFVYTVARNLWINRLKKKQKQTVLTEKEDPGLTAQDFVKDMITTEREALVRKVFSQLGSPCEELLIGSIAQGLSMKELCKKMDLPSEEAARAQKYRCKKKLMELVKKIPGIGTQLRG